MQTLSKHSAIRRRFGQNSRRRGNEKHKITLRPNVSAGHGFLRHHFQPVWNCDPLEGGQAEIEAAFYRSLSFVEALYKFKTPRCRGKSFPFNIAADFETARQRLEKINPRLTLFISMDEQRRPCVCAAMPYNTASTLFYIPVKPLYVLTGNKCRKKTAELLLSLYAYLHLVLEIPYYRDSDSFMYGCYQVMKEQFDQYEDEGEAIDANTRIKFRELETAGDKLAKKIKDPFHLEQLEKRVNNFKPSNKLDKEILSVARLVLAISKEYPEQSLFDHIPEQLIYPEEYDRITAGQYISFYWSCEDEYISTWVFEYVSGCFENCGAIDEPVGYQMFNSPQRESVHDLRFATLVFEMIEKLCTTLNDVK